jgi:GT2 family glycosyltransferase
MPSVLSSWVMSKNTFNFVGGFDKRYTYAQDYEFFFRALKKGVDICIVNEEMTCYRINVNGVSTLRHREQKYFAMHAQLSDNEKKEDPGIFVQRMLKKNVFSMRRTLASECIRKSLTIDKKRLGWLLSRTALLIVALILDPFEFKKKLKRHSIIFLNSSVNSINSKKL